MSKTMENHSNFLEERMDQTALKHDSFDRT